MHMRAEDLELRDNLIMLKSSSKKLPSGTIILLMIALQ